MLHRLQRSPGHSSHRLYAKFSPFPKKDSSVSNNSSPFPRINSSPFKSFSPFPQGETSAFQRKNSPSFIKTGFSLFPRGETSSYPRKNSQSFTKTGFSPFPRGETSAFPRTNASSFPKENSSPILIRRSRYPVIGKQGTMKDFKTVNSSPTKRNPGTNWNKSQENAASSLNRLVLASLSLWIGAIAFYWMAKWKELKPCDPNKPPEIVMSTKSGEKSFKASNSFQAKLPNVTKQRRYKDFKEACNRLKPRGVIIKQSRHEKGLVQFSYTVERPTLEEVIEDEKKLKHIVNDEIKELNRLENFSKFVRWFKYAK